DIHQHVALIEGHETHALRGTPDHADLAHPLAVDDAVARDQHQLVVRQNALDRDDLSGLIIDTEVDHTHAAARLEAVIVDCSALAAPLLRRHEQRGFRAVLLADHDHSHDRVLAAQPDAANTGRDAAHL